MIIGGYELQLYCDNAKSGEFGTVRDNIGHSHAEFPHYYTGETGSNCRKMARRDGWELNLKAHVAFCPKCTANKNG